MGAQPVLLVDARTAWDELAFPAIPVVKAWFVTSGPDGYAFAVAPVVAEAHAIELRRIDDQRVTLGGSPPFPMSELASAISSTHEHCATIPLLLLSGDWRVGEVLQTRSGVTRRATGRCRWQDGDWVDDH